MLLTEAIEALLVATVADGRRPRTVQFYRQNLASLVAFLGDQPVDQVAVGDLRRFIADLRGQGNRYAGHPYHPEELGGLSDASVAAHVRAVKRLFNFLEAEGCITSNPARRIKKIKPPRGEPKGISSEDLRKLLEACAGAEVHQVRNRAIVLLLADSGMRVGGLVGLRLRDVDFAHGQAVVTEKGNKTRIAFFSELTAEALQAWLAVRPGPTDYLWPNLNEPGQPMKTSAVGEILRRLKKRAQIRGPCNPHAFRHGFARAWIEKGGDIGQLADVLGHADVQTTWQSYAIFRSRELAAKHAKFSPVATMGRESKT